MNRYRGTPWRVPVVVVRLLIYFVRGVVAVAIAVARAVPAHAVARSAGRSRRNGNARITAMRILMVGGTGPSGIPIVRRLVEHGHDVTILHRGEHERSETPPDLVHIHAD